MPRLGRLWKGLEPTERPTMRDIVWAVGVYDGEGSCNKGSDGTAQLTVGQKDRWLCDRLRALFGGSIGFSQNSGQHRRPDGKWYPGTPMYVWRLSGSRARGFLMTIYARVSPRRRAQIARVFGWKRVASHYRIAYLRPTMQEIAWAAGLYEGEGTCQKDQYGNAGVQLSQKDPWLLDRLRTNFRGSINSYNNRGRRQHRWIVTGPKARGFLMTIYAFLSPRRKLQVARVLA